MRVLIGCERSGRVRDAFIAKGHDAMSCDLHPTDLPGPHYQGDIRDVLGDGWDMMIVFPDCTYLCSSGLHWNTRRPGRAKKTDDAIDFVRMLLDQDIDKIVLENPIGCISTRIRKPDQIIQPWMFGVDASKATCLWLKNVEPLEPTNHIDPSYVCKCGYRFDYSLGKYGCANCCGQNVAKAIYGNQTPSGQNKIGPSADRAYIRSITYQPIADAMAERWGAHND